MAASAELGVAYLVLSLGFFRASFLLSFVFSQLKTAVLTTSPASLQAEPFIDTWRRAPSISFLILFLCLVFRFFKALAPLSGQALVTGS